LISALTYLIKRVLLSIDNSLSLREKATRVTRSSTQ
jgi:hypothetical protein